MKHTRWLFAIALLPVSLFAATVTGLVTGGAGNTPLAGARIILSSQTESDTVMTNAQGRFTFENVSTGVKILQATMTGYQNGGGVANVMNASATVTVDIHLNAVGGPMGSVAGTVRNALNQQPIANALVAIGRFGAGGSFGDSTRTNAQGQYSFAAVPAQGGYSMTVVAPGFQNGSQTGVNVSTGQTTTVNFNLNPQPSSLRSALGHPVAGGFYRTGGRHALEIGFSDKIRIAEAYAWNGALRYKALVPAGTSRIALPSGLASEDMLVRILGSD